MCLSGQDSYKEHLNYFEIHKDEPDVKKQKKASVKRKPPTDFGYDR
jgi:hypothetical protein